MRSQVGVGAGARSGQWALGGEGRVMPLFKATGQLHAPLIVGNSLKAFMLSMFVTDWLFQAHIHRCLIYRKS